MKKYIDTGKKDTRSGFGAGLLEAGKRDSRVLALTADLKGSVKMDAFADAFPERYFECGIAEANMIGAAAGMAIDTYGISEMLWSEHVSGRPGCIYVTPRGGTAVSAASMAVPENFQFLAESINAAIPGNAFSHMVNILSPATEGDNSALIACIVSAVWAIGLPIVSFILFKMRATLNRG